jgi:hypothetical protein
MLGSHPPAPRVQISNNLLPSSDRQRYEETKRNIDELNDVLETIDKMQKTRGDNLTFIRNVVATNVRRKFNILIADFAKQTGSEIFLRIDIQRKELRFIFKVHKHEIFL